MVLSIMITSMNSDIVSQGTRLLFGMPFYEWNFPECKSINQI
jgi:hypothetical protein